ncbi:MAG TPA: S41 family peptidase [Candidatus Baltobacteraceae bacterium]|nr:S41 family peptidase [Candidatus Baltobacteraceae bacterium]
MNRITALPLVAALLFAAGQVPAAGSVPQVSISALDATEIQFSYEKLRADFYQKTDPQLIVDGARSELEKELHTAGVSATLPPVFADDDSARTAKNVDHEVDLASRAAHGKMSGHELAYAAIRGMLDSVHDRYTVFLSPKDYAELNQGLDGGSFAGTGIVIQQDEQTHLIGVSNVVPGGPADKAGVQQDDLILTIDGVSTKNLTIQQASSHLRGKAGSTVQLTLQRDGKPLAAPIVITRAEIHELSVYSKMLPNKIGYVELTVFGKDTGAELTRALDRLQQDGARAIVMDLRDNGGGYLEAALDVSSKFIASGPIVSVESRASNITTYEAEDTAIPPLPLVVLVNEHTASASEITSGAIQDSGVGTIIGNKTFGKGVVQEILPLPDGAAIKITDARYLTPHNRDINHLGIMPDIVVSENKSPRYGDPLHDSQLGRAVQYLNDRIAHTPSGATMDTPAQQQQ